MAASSDTCQQAPRFCKRRGIAPSLDRFIIYDNTRTPDIHKNIIFCLLLRVSAELRHLQCFQKQILKIHQRVTHYNRNTHYTALISAAEFEIVIFHKTWLKFCTLIHWRNFRHRIHYTSVTNLLLSLCSVYEVACSRRHFTAVYVTCAYVGFINGKFIQNARND